MFGFGYDDYPDCYGSDEEEAYEALSWSQRLDMLEEMCEPLGVVCWFSVKWREDALR